jgi:hypothetical protein
MIQMEFESLGGHTDGNCGLVLRAARFKLDQDSSFDVRQGNDGGPVWIQFVVSVKPFLRSAFADVG